MHSTNNLLTRAIIVIGILTVAGCEEPPAPVQSAEERMCTEILAVVSGIVVADQLPSGRKNPNFDAETLRVANEVGPVWWDRCVQTVTPAQHACYQGAQDAKQAKKCAKLANPAQRAKEGDGLAQHLAQSRSARP